jgi:hypothetical protein
MKSDAEAAEAFSQYLKFWMRERGLQYPIELVDRAARKGAQISNTKVNTVLLGQYANHRMRLLEAIALGIGRPLEEVFQAALGYVPAPVEHPDFKESDMAHLWHVMRQLSPKKRKFYDRMIRMLANDIERGSDENSGE